MHIDENHPLLLSNLTKTQTSADALIQSSVRVVEGYGRNLAKRPTFNDHRAVGSFGSWCYKACMINAKGVARSKLRQYASTPRGTKKARDFKTKSAWRHAVNERLAAQAKGETLDNRVLLFETRPVPIKRKRFMLGEGTLRPSDRVVSKVAEMGTDFEEVTEQTPVMKLLSKPNPWMTGFDLIVLKMVYLQLCGNHYLHHVDDVRLGVPTELWPMPSQWTRIIPSQEVLIDGYAYGRDSQTARKFGTDEVIHWKLPNPKDPFFYGMGCVEAVWDALDLHDAKREQDAAKFRNHGRPDWLLIVKNGGSTEMLDRLEEQIDSKLRGARNAGKFLTVTGEVDAKMLNQQIDLVGDADVIIEEIAAGFDVPVTKLKANDPNRANADSADESWLRDTILPYLSMDEEKLNSDYLTLFEGSEDSILAYDNPVPEDSVKEVKRITDLRIAGIISADEGREEQGYGPAVDGGDTLLAPRGSTVVGRTQPDDDLAVGDSPDGETAEDKAPDRPSLTSEQITAIRQIVSDAATGKLPRDAALAMLKLMFPLSDDQAAAMLGSEPTEPEPTKEPETESVIPAGSNAGDGLLSEAGKGTAAKAITPNRIGRIGEDGLAAPLPQGHDLKLALQQIFGQQKHAVLNRLHPRPKSIETKDDDRRDDRPPEQTAQERADELDKIAKDWFDIAGWTQRMVEAAMPSLTVTAQDAAKELSAKIGVDVFSVVDRNLPQAVRDLALKFSASTNATTSQQLDNAKEQLRQEILDGTVQGDTRAELAKRVQKVFEMADKERATTIAQTETSRALHSAELMTAKESGVVKSKSWLASADCCDACSEIAAKGEIPLDEPYATSDYGDVDGPPLHPNCQCSQTMQIKDLSDVDLFEPGDE